MMRYHIIKDDPSHQRSSLSANTVCLPYDPTKNETLRLENFLIMYREQLHCSNWPLSRGRYIPEVPAGPRNLRDDI